MTGGEDGVSGAVHKVGAGASVHVNVNKAGDDETTAGIDFCVFSTRPFSAGNGVDQMAAGEHHAVPQQAIGENNGAVEDCEHGLSTLGVQESVEQVTHRFVAVHAANGFTEQFCDGDAGEI